MVRSFNRSSNVDPPRTVGINVYWSPFTFVDCGGFRPGRDLEWQGMIRHGAELVHAYAAATVPRIGVIEPLENLDRGGLPRPVHSDDQQDRRVV